MKNTKSNKGITLIALIITIVILMVLAGVAISSIQGENGILAYAHNSKIAWGEGQKNEAGIIGGYEQYLNNMENDDNIEDNTNGEDKCQHQFEEYFGIFKCKICDEECIHYDYSPYAGVLAHTGVCPNCGFTCNHSWWYHSICQDCGLLCPHAYKTSTSYQQCGEWEHIPFFDCEDCGGDDEPVSETCTDSNGDSVCDYCGNGRYS